MANLLGNRVMRDSGAQSIRLNWVSSLLFRLTCLSVFLGVVAYGQIGGNQFGSAADSDRLAAATKEVSEGNWASVDEIAKAAGAPKAIPILHGLFADSHDTEVKERIAGELLKLGDKDPSYFDFMLLQATEVVDSGMPFPFRLGPEGVALRNPQQNRKDREGMIAQQLSPEFLVWAKGRGVPVDSAAINSTLQDAIYTLPGRVAQLGMTGDKRAIPILRRGLLSPNFMVQVSAAEGLAEMRDTDSIPLIIDACERTPAAAPAIAMFALRSFDDPRAQSVAQSYVAKLEDAARKRRAEQVTNSDADQPK